MICGCRRIKRGIATRVVTGVSPSQGRIVPSQGPQAAGQQQLLGQQMEQQEQQGPQASGHSQEQNSVHGGRRLMGKGLGASTRGAGGIIDGSGGDGELSSERVVSAVMHVEGEDFDRYLLRALARS